MQDQVNKLERLDIAAKAIMTRNMLHRARFWLFVMAAFCTLLGIISTASQLETVVVRVIAVAAWVLLLLSWLEWRYSFHALAFFWAGLGIGISWASPQPHHAFGWIVNVCFAVCLIMFAWNFWQIGTPFAIIHKKGWEEERATASRIYARLISGVPESATAFWVAAGSFWVGYFSYRLIFLEDYWAVATFRREKFHRMLEFRVLEKDAVRVSAPAGAKLELYIAGKKIRNAQLSPEGYEKLMGVAVHSSSA